MTLAQEDTLRGADTLQGALDDAPDDLAAAATAARTAARQLARTTSAQRRAALEAMAVSLEESVAAVLAANEADVARAQANGVSTSTVDRLKLTAERIA